MHKHSIEPPAPATRWCGRLENL